ncbi:MAG: MnmC family methyltransferase [Candidatus Nezhaarchaeales archaeon]
MIVSEDSIKELLQQRRYDEVDRISRIAALEFKDRILSLSWEELWSLIDRITGGLGYTSEDRDITRLIIYGTHISWAEAVRRGSKVLEIGTGLGRTCYSILSTTSPSLYLTIDSSPEILAAALHRNPYPPFREALSSPIVKICLCDAVNVVRYINDLFDHIVHDGGPNPNKNPSLFSSSFLGDLVSLLKIRGTLSIFGSKSRKWQNKLYHELKSLGLSVTSVSLPYTSVLVFHCIKE